MTIILTAVAVIALSVAAMLLAGRSLLRIALTGLCLATTLGLAFQRDLAPLARALLTLVGLVASLQAIRIGASAPARWSTAARIWSAFVPFDVRSVHSGKMRWNATLIFKLVLFPWVLLAAVWLPLNHSGALSPVAALLLKLACGALFAYVVLDLAAQALRLVHGFFGLDTGPLQRDPILSRTVAEFWGERWNLPISRWLHQHCFRPWAKRGHPTAGMVAAFTASAALHFWLFFAVVGFAGGLSAGLFFLLQVPALFLERQWRIRRWPSPLARLWTLAFVLGTSPLLIMPMIRGLEMQMAH